MERCPLSQHNNCVCGLVLWHNGDCAIKASPAMVIGAELMLQSIQTQKPPVESTEGYAQALADVFDWLLVLEKASNHEIGTALLRVADQIRDAKKGKRRFYRK